MRGFRALVFRAKFVWWGAAFLAVAKRGRVARSNCARPTEYAFHRAISTREWRIQDEVEREDVRATHRCFVMGRDVSLT